jgi:hypothetical protein
MEVPQGISRSRRVRTATLLVLITWGAFWYGHSAGMRIGEELLKIQAEGFEATAAMAAAVDCKGMPKDSECLKALRKVKAGAAQSWEFADRHQEYLERVMVLSPVTQPYVWYSLRPALQCEDAPSSRRCQVEDDGQDQKQ